MWVLFSIFAAFFQASTDIASKNYLKNKKTSEKELCFGMFLFAMLLLLPMGLSNIPNEIEKNFFIILPISGLLDAIATLFYLKAIKEGELGEVTPLQMTTPLFAIFFAPFISGDSISVVGFLGILLIILGAYSLNIKASKQNFLAPLFAIVHSKASRCMLLAAFLWSIVNCLNKAGTQISNPFFWGFCSRISLLIFSYFLFFKHKTLSLNFIHHNYKYFLLVGTLSAFATLCIFLAYNTGNSIYVISVKRTSALIGICLGHFLYHETNFKERFAGASIMILGVFLLAR